LESIKDERALDIVYTLDLFDGKLSLGEIMNIDIPFLNRLRRAKIKINNDLRNQQNIK
jgi:hypothetical protein